MVLGADAGKGAKAMMSDWTKMRTDLYRDPKVCQMAEVLSAPDGPLASYVNQHCQCDMAVTRNVTRNAVVGALVSVWGVCRHRGKRVGNDLFLKLSTIGVIDDIADMPGFGEAMESVGWVIDDANGLTFPSFFEDWNVEPTQESKKKNAERQRRHREKSNALRNVTVTSQSNARGEKRREEKSTEEELNGALPRIDSPPLEITPRPMAEFVDSPEAVAQEFSLAFDGPVNASERDVRHVTPMIRAVVGFGFPISEVRAEIHRADRDKNEKIWQFKKRFEQRLARAPTGPTYTGIKQFAARTERGAT